MQFRRSDLTDLSYFLELAKHRNFRKAGLELGDQRIRAKSCASRIRRTPRRTSAESYDS